MASDQIDVAARDVNGMRASACDPNDDTTAGVTRPPATTARGPRGRTDANPTDGEAGRDAELSDALRHMIEQSVRDAVGHTFSPDPTFGPAVSRAVSIGASFQRRHGNIILAAMADGLEAGGHVTVLRDLLACRVPICPTARQIASELDAETCAALDVGYDRNPDTSRPFSGPKTVDVDAVVLDRRDGTALAIESKRGGKIGAAQHRQLVENTSVVSLLMRAHLRSSERAATRGDAVVLVQHADRGLTVPDPLGTTLEALDRRYEGLAERTVRAATSLHAGLVCNALLEPFEQAVRELRTVLGLPVADAEDGARDADVATDTGGSGGPVSDMPPVPTAA